MVGRTRYWVFVDVTRVVGGVQGTASGDGVKIAIAVVAYIKENKFSDALDGGFRNYSYKKRLTVAGTIVTGVSVIVEVEVKTVMQEQALETRGHGSCETCDGKGMSHLCG